jgi:hypothetical protein
MLSLKCQCGQDKWIIHPEKIECAQCHWKEHFMPHESVAELVMRMRGQGAFFLDKDKIKPENYPVLILGGYKDRH